MVVVEAGRVVEGLVMPDGRSQDSAISVGRLRVTCVLGPVRLVERTRLWLGMVEDTCYRHLTV